jgi:SAM-dependent methyltransferase
MVGSMRFRPRRRWSEMPAAEEAPLSMRRPAGAARRVEAGRLVYYREDPDAAFWDDHWRGHAEVDPYASAERGFLGPLERPILGHLPREGKILEAGCGPGQHVLALRRRGYDVEGVDWAPETVARAQARPGLPITVGNVAHLPVPDGHYAGYLSFGVVEHRREGPEALLREAHRVVRPGGIALVSVPYFHGLRRLKSRLGAYRNEPTGAAFYQYAFTRDEFCALLVGSGFGIVRVYGYDGYKGIVDEVPWLRYLLDRQLGRYHLGSLAQRALRHLPWIEGQLGHMLLVVAQKPAR